MTLHRRSEDHKLEHHSNGHWRERHEDWAEIDAAEALALDVNRLTSLATELSFFVKKYVLFPLARRVDAEAAERRATAIAPGRDGGGS